MESDNKINNTKNKESKRIFGFRPCEFILLTLNIVSVITTFIFFDKDWLSFSCALVGCFAILFLAKGFFFAPEINAVYDFLYIILSYKCHNFGAMWSYIIATFPIDIYVSFTWKKQNEDTNVIKINKISKKEWIYFGVISLCLTPVSYFILLKLNSDNFRNTRFYYSSYGRVFAY